MKTMVVDTESIGSLQKSVQESYQRMTDALEAMKRSIEDLNNYWEGPNHDEFVNSFSEQFADMTTVNKSIENFSGNLDKARGSQQI
jgi:WXG100 family type VII secretion target